MDKDKTNRIIQYHKFAATSLYVLINYYQQYQSMQCAQISGVDFILEPITVMFRHCVGPTIKKHATLCSVLFHLPPTPPFFSGKHNTVKFKLNVPTFSTYFSAQN